MNKIINIFKYKTIFIFISMLILVPSFYFNITSYTTNSGINEIDSFSEGLMISDMMYNNNYINESMFLKVIHPLVGLIHGETGAPDEILSRYVNNKSYDQVEYATYESNITAHRLIYNFIDNLFPNNKSNVVGTIKLINAFFLALMITIILVWIRRSLSEEVTYILLLILAFCSDYFVPYGTNLYWIASSMFLPMAVSIIIIHRKDIASKKNKIIMFSLTFASCLIKQLFYFEFVSVVMISMMIPYFLYILENKLKFIESIKLLLYPILGALASFLIACIIKFLMLCKSYNWGRAIDIFFDPIIYRLFGDINSKNLSISTSTNYPISILMNDMLSFKVISIKGLFTINEALLIIVSIILIMISYLTFKNNKDFVDSMEFPFIIITAISLLAPISWFVLAKPHTVVHEPLCVILWFLPFNILLIAIDIYILVKLFKKFICKLPINIRQLKNKSFIIIICTILCLITMYFNKDIASYKYINMNIVNEEGIDLYSSNEIKIIFYSGSLYYVTQKTMTSQFYLHIIPTNPSDLDKNSQLAGFANYDFDFNKYKVIEPYKINGNEIVKIELPSYPIDNILTGQYSLNNEELKVLWEERIDLSQLTNLPSDYTFSPYNLSDSNWNRGISNDGTIILLSGADSRLISLKGKNIYTSGGIMSKVINVEYVSGGWTHLILKDPILLSDSNDVLIFDIK